MKQVEINFIVNEKCLLLDSLYKNIKNKSKNNIKSLLKNDCIMVNGIVRNKFDYALNPKDNVKVKLVQVNDNINVLYEDKYFIAVDKPFGLLTIATDKEKERTMYHYVRDYLKYNGNKKVFIVHRLDKDTSGIVLFSKDMRARDTLQRQWNNSIRKYIAIVEGITDNSGTVKSYLKENKEHFSYSSNEGELAITNYKKIKNNSKYSMLEILIETGKKNQIRVHMNDINHPILGDKKYGSTINPINRVALHASELEFIHPVTNKKIKIVSEIPSLFYRMFNV